MFRSQWEKVSALVEGGTFAASVLQKTGFLGALSPGGVVAFAKQARSQRPGPHLALMLHSKNKPEKLALVDGSRRLSFGELDTELNKLAHALANAGVSSGDRVALMMPNCLEYVLVQSALPRIGAYAVQIGYRLKAPEVAYILDNSEPTALIYHAQYEDTVRAAVDRAGGPADAQLLVVGATPDDGELRSTRLQDAMSEHHGSEPPPVRGDGVGGVIVYTSGTTGKPKGANRNFKKTGLEAAADFMSTMGMSHHDRHLAICPLYHSAAPAFVQMTYTLGGTVVVMDHFDPEAVLAVIEKERITSAFMVPTMLVRLTAVAESKRRKFDLSSLRWICSGAAPLPTDTAREFQEAFGRILWNFYGATETGLVTLAGPDDHASRPGTVGRVLRGNELLILDEDGNECGAGEVGELWARNKMIISGYHKNQEATDKSMRDGYFSVGDLARIDEDGFVYLASRKHDMVISGGVNIYPREIEDHLHTHPDIIDAAVIGVPDEKWGESLKAFLVLRTGAELAAEEVAAFCKESLADYKQPRQVEFVDELPRNPTGKILKRELRAR